MDKPEEHKKESREFFDKQANQYDSTLAGRQSKRLYDFIIRTMDRFEYKSVLDVGCGTGNLLFEVLKRKKVSTAGIDLSEKMIDVAKMRLGEEADLRSGDSEHLPWKSESFDMVTCTLSFHHYPNPEAVLDEMKRVLNPGGKVIIADPWAPSPFRQIANLLIPLGNSGTVRFYSESEMRNMLEKCGFTLITWETVGVGIIPFIDRIDRIGVSVGTAPT
jgi:ubiquinone/menaquinone biosynthesis C-methylase UbiE